MINDLETIWNLVLACRDCNRGPKGKFDSVPHADYVARLHRRNEYLIASHHPLRETLIGQTGTVTQERKQFLQAVLEVAGVTNPSEPWTAPPSGDPTIEVPLGVDPSASAAASEELTATKSRKLFETVVAFFPTLGETGCVSKAKRGGDS